MHDLFVYGSLLNLSSATAAIGEVRASMYKEAYLPCASLAFDVPLSVRMSSGTQIVDFLNVHMQGGGVLGMLITIDNQQLSRLRHREKKYSVKEASLSDGHKVILFARAPEKGESLLCCKSHSVLRAYVDKILNGAKVFGNDFYCRYKNQLDHALAGESMLDGAYSFMDKEINSLTDIHS